MRKLTLRRIAPGYYETTDGKYEIGAWERPEADGYGPAGERQWYWRPTNGQSNDIFDTKRDAVAALVEHIEENDND